MDFSRWETYYSQILADFGFDRREDERAAVILSELLKDKPSSVDDLRPRIEGRRVTIAGDAETLEREIGTASGAVISADEATSVLLERDINPDAFTTDLDGRIEDLVRANSQGSIAIIHAHGDNIPALREHARRFKGPVIGTTQAEPVEGIHNFGGFTDGDRAVFIADHFGAKEIRLVGFDFDNPREKDKDPKVKARKLDWAYVLIQSLDNENITSPSF
ncbi:MAG: 6-hydroxymethylpterin diphosphokinase MptE-like protein [Thermoplasmata archaeon]